MYRAWSLSPLNLPFIASGLTDDSKQCVCRSLEEGPPRDTGTEVICAARYCPGASETRCNSVGTVPTVDSLHRGGWCHRLSRHPPLLREGGKTVHAHAHTDASKENGGKTSETRRTRSLAKRAYPSARCTPRVARSSSYGRLSRLRSHRVVSARQTRVRHTLYPRHELTATSSDQQRTVRPTNPTIPDNTCCSDPSAEYFTGPAAGAREPRACTGCESLQFRRDKFSLHENN